MTSRRYAGDSGVLDYLARKYGRGQMQMGNLLDQFVLMKQLKEERAEREREWGFKEKGQLEAQKN